MDMLSADPADSDCTPLYEIQQPLEKSSKQVPKILLDVSELLLVQKSIAGSCISQNSTNNAPTLENTDSSDDDIIILHESAKKADSYAAQNKEKTKSDSKNTDLRNNNDTDSRILNDVAIDSKSRNLSKRNDAFHKDVIRQREVHPAIGSRSKRKYVFDNDIRVVDDVTIEKVSCSPETETRSKITEEDDDIILDAVVLKIKAKNSRPVSTSQDEDIVNNNTRILDWMACQDECYNLKQSVSRDKNGPNNDVVILDKAPRVDMYFNSENPKSKDERILENNIKILTVSSITNKEYNKLPEFKTENKCNYDKQMICITENKSSCTEESIFLENSKNCIRIQNENENMIQCCDLPISKKMKISVKLNTKSGKNFIRQVGYFPMMHEVKQSLENLISCYNEIGYSSNENKHLNEESNFSSAYKNKNVSKKVNCSFLGKKEKIQNEFSVRKKEYSSTPKSKTQKESILFCDEIISDEDMTTNSTPSSPELIFTRSSKNYFGARRKNVNKIQFCNTAVVRETKCDVESSTKDRNSFIGKVGLSSVIRSDEIEQVSIKDLSHNNEFSKRNKSLIKKSNSFHEDIVSSNPVFEKGEECQKNKKEILTGKENNWSPESETQNNSIPFDDKVMLDADITDNNAPSSQELIFAQNSKNCIGIKGEDENVTRVYNLRVKSGAKNTKKYGKSCIDNVRHSSMIQKNEVRQSPIKDVSCNNEVGYPSKKSKSLTEESNSCNSFKDKKFSRKGDCLLFGKKEKSQKKQNELSVSHKECNPFHDKITLNVSITDKNSTNSQNKIQCCSLADDKKKKNVVKPAMKNEKNLISKYAHSSVIRKCEVEQTSMKTVSSNNEVGYSTKENKSLAEKLNSCNSFKNRSISKDMNSSLFSKKESKTKQNEFSNTIKKNIFPPKSKAQNIEFASLDDELLMDVDKTEKNTHTSKELNFAHNSKYHIGIQEENQNNVQCCKLSDVKKSNGGVKLTTKGQKTFTGKVKHSAVNQKSEAKQYSIKKISCNNKDCNLLKKNNSPKEESNSSNFNKVTSYSKNVNCSLLEKKVGSKKNQASCRAIHTMSQNLESEFDRGYKCIWCSFATPDKNVIEKHLKEKHKESEKVKCPYCYSRPTNGDFFNHLKSHLDEPPYFCQQCPYSTESINYFVSHIRCHKQNSPRKFHCENCSFSTDIRLEFSEHKVVHTPEYEVIRKEGKAFSCKVCKEIFHNKKRLTEHQKIHKDKEKISKKSAESNRNLF